MLYPSHLQIGHMCQSNQLSFSHRNVLVAGDLFSSEVAGKTVATCLFNKRLGASGAVKAPQSQLRRTLRGGGPLSDQRASV